MQITNGKFSYGRTVKTGDYENARADAELSFSVEEGSDPASALTAVGDMAVAEVHRRLGLKAPAGVVTDKAKIEEKVRAAAAEKPAEPRKPGRPPKAAETKPQISTGAERVDPAQVVEEVDTSATADAAAITDDFAPEAAVEEISDQTFMSALNHRAKELGDAKPIRKLVGEYVKAPQTAVDVPQAKRREFLDKLKALTAG